MVIHVYALLGGICILGYMGYFIPWLKIGPKRGNILLHEAKKKKKVTLNGHKKHACECVQRGLRL